MAKCYTIALLIDKWVSNKLKINSLASSQQIDSYPMEGFVAQVLNCHDNVTLPSTFLNEPHGTSDNCGEATAMKKCLS